MEQRPNNLPDDGDVARAKMVESHQALYLAERVLYCSITLTGPAACFLLVRILTADLSRGNFWRLFPFLILQPEASKYFFPLLIYSTLALNLVLLNTRTFAPAILIRLGVYLGFLLALQYSILDLWLVPPTFEFSLSVGLPFVLVPLVVTFIMGRVSWMLISHYEILSLRSVMFEALGVVGWGVAYLTAWRLAFDKVLEMYARLPTTSTSCYIATAASHGHDRLVGPRIVIYAKGKSITVTKQLLTLKCGELAIQSKSPRFHEYLRKVYDTLGPPLARILVVHPLLADFAYLTLKPFEWATLAVLKPIA